MFYALHGFPLLLFQWFKILIFSWYTRALQSSIQRFSFRFVYFTSCVLLLCLHMYIYTRVPGAWRSQKTHWIPYSWSYGCCESWCKCSEHNPGPPSTPKHWAFFLAQYFIPNWSSLYYLIPFLCLLSFVLCFP